MEVRQSTDNCGRMGKQAVKILLAYDFKILCVYIFFKI
jgi:hypothetical protein